MDIQQYSLLSRLNSAIASIVIPSWVVGIKSSSMFRRRSHGDLGVIVRNRFFFSKILIFTLANVVLLIVTFALVIVFTEAIIIVFAFVVVILKKKGEGVEKPVISGRQRMTFMLIKMVLAND